MLVDKVNFVGLRAHSPGTLEDLGDSGVNCPIPAIAADNANDLLSHRFILMSSITERSNLKRELSIYSVGSEHHESVQPTSCLVCRKQ